MHFFGVPSETWFPVITLIIGALLKGTFDALTDRRIEKRERAARRERRLDEIQLRRANFQRATLLELQEAISQLARFTGKSHHLDVVAHRKTGKWQKQYLPEDLGEGLLVANTNVSRLRVRVRDEEIRRLAESFSKNCADIAVSGGEAVAEKTLRQMGSVLVELHERIGLVLRNLDDDEDRVG